jgi:hypothetical protein
MTSGLPVNREQPGRWQNQGITSAMPPWMQASIFEMALASIVSRTKLAYKTLLAF